MKQRLKWLFPAFL
ncbi:hypothetical protein YPPY45_0951, partial [Yersinia pestis PY-45]